ncbi:MAG: carboxypeptidase regulatory-like domain-containing protein [Chthonomonadetes bacterium]|nr:carboxypeptidase regulatory-like domain-containing protein [Chthonomonadetes bacterium]
MLRTVWVALLMAMVTACQAQQEQITFAGKVTTPEGKSVGGAEVVLYAAQWDDIWLKMRTPILQRVKTSEGGTFEVSHERGKYREWTILVFKPGYGVWVRRFAESKTDLNISLPTALAVSGIVTGTQGKPLAGVKVRVQTLIVPGLPMSFSEWFTCPDIPALSAVTDNAGRFRIANLPPGAQARLLFSAPGYARASVDARAGAPPVTVALPKEVRITGRVLHADTGKGAEGVVVRAGMPFSPVWESYELPSARTDASGRFVLAQLPPGKHIVWVDLRLTKPNLVAAPQSLPKTEEGKSRRCPDFLLKPGIPVSGTVRDAQTGQGVAGIQITSQYRQVSVVPTIWGPSTTSAQDGTFTLYLPEGDWSVDIQSSRGYSRADQAQEISLKRDKNPTELHFTVVRTARAILHVTDPNGNPLDEIIVESAGLLKAQERGVFVLEPLEPNQNHKLRVVDKQQTLGAEIAFTPQPGQEVEVTVTLSPLLTVSGRLVDRNRRPVQQAEVVLVQREQLGRAWMMMPRLTVPVQPDGRFVLRVLPGRYAFLFSSLATAPLSLPETPIDTDKDLGEIVLEPATGFIAGRVYNADGEPVAGAYVSVYDETLLISKQATTDNQGRYRVTGLPAGKKMMVQITAEGMTGYRIDVPVGSVDVNFVLTPYQVRLPEARLKPGSPAPPLSGLRVLSGRSLPRLKGQVVLLQFASAYNPAVEEQSRWLRKLQARYASRGLRIVAVYDASLPLPQLQAYLRAQRLPYVACTVPPGAKLGWDSAVFRAYGVHSVPSL